MLFSWLAAIAKAVNNKYKQIDQENIISFIIMPNIIVYYIKIIRHLDAFAENLLTRETIQWTTKTYIK